jgi:hypothetical protein
MTPTLAPVGGKLHRTRTWQVSGARGFWQKSKKFNQMSFGLTGPDGHPWVRIGTRTRLDPGAGSGAPTGQFPDPHPTGAKPAGDPAHGCILPSLARNLVGILDGSPLRQDSSQATIVLGFVGRHLFWLAQLFLSIGSGFPDWIATWSALLILVTRLNFGFGSASAPFDFGSASAHGFCWL